MPNSLKRKQTHPHLSLGYTFLLEFVVMQGNYSITHEPECLMCLPSKLKWQHFLKDRRRSIEGWGGGGGGGRRKLLT